MLVFACCCCALPMQFGFNPSQFSINGAKPTVDPNLPAADLPSKIECQSSHGGVIIGITTTHQAFMSNDGGNTWSPVPAGTQVKLTCNDDSIAMLNK